jgi:hypothetical protein
MTAAQITEIKTIRLCFNAGVLTRDLRVRHAQIALAAAPDAEGKVEQRIRAGAVGVGEKQARLIV